MKFVLVNHRIPNGDRLCNRCYRPLGQGYLRDVRTRIEYCDYNCYRCRHFVGMAFPHFPMSSDSSSPDTKDLIPPGLAPLLIAASCWYQVGLASMSWITVAHAFSPFQRSHSS